jgi:1,4-alpha-glucan branching enzyme
VTALSDDDLHLFNEGTHYRLHHKLGAHPGTDGTRFAVWAPDARAVEVLGDWSHWQGGAALAVRGQSGIWEGTVPGAAVGHRYKFRIHARDGRIVDKADPFAAACEVPPATASVIWRQTHQWSDGAWMAERAGRARLTAPWSIYEVHLGSWMRADGEGGAPLDYRALGERLAEHCGRLGFTHVELLPILAHPFYGSWGYQVTGYFAPTPRYGSPDDLMAMIDTLHRAGLGVIVDWVPAHFPTDAHGLGEFDGTHLYEHADPRRGFHPDWTSYIFNYARHEVRAFLISSRCAGSSATTSTRCGSTASPRCCIATTRASPASGCPTSTAPTATATRSGSCSSATARSTPRTPTSRPSPRSRRRGRG